MAKAKHTDALETMGASFEQLINALSRCSGKRKDSDLIAHAGPNEHYL